MRGSTHALIGAVVGLAITQSDPSLHTLIVIGAGAIAGLLPDIDHPRSRIRNAAGLPGHVAFGWMKHRGITHSLAAVVAVFFAVHLISDQSIGAAVLAGYALHLFADYVTVQGIPLLLPFTARRFAMPLMRLRTGGLIEHIFVLFLGILSMAMIAKAL